MNQCWVDEHLMHERAATARKRNEPKNPHLHQLRGQCWRHLEGRAMHETAATCANKTFLYTVRITQK